MILIGNKTDLKDNRQVPKEEGQELANNHNMLFFETCAMNSGITGCFKLILDKILKDIDNNIIDPYDERNGIRVGTFLLGEGKEWSSLKNKKKKKGGCC